MGSYKATKNNIENVEQTHDEKNEESTQKALQAGLEVAEHIPVVNMYAKAAKIVDKATGGALTKGASKMVNQGLKNSPMGNQVQESINNANDSGLTDTVGNVASMKDGGSSKTTNMFNSNSTNKNNFNRSASFSFGNKSNSSFLTPSLKVKIIICCSVFMLFMLIFFSVFAQDDLQNLYLTNNSSMTDKGTGGVNLGNIVYYNQNNYTNSYGYGETIAAAGCGPTAMAMVLSTLTGNTVTPVDTADWSLNNGYRVASGTSWGFFPAIASEYGITCENISLASINIAEALTNGKLIILSVKPNTTFAPFSSGHFIVLTGIDGEGKISVADPYNENNSSQTWDINTFVNDGRSGGIWAFSK